MEELLQDPKSQMFQAHCEAVWAYLEKENTSTSTIRRSRPHNFLILSLIICHEMRAASRSLTVAWAGAGQTTPLKCRDDREMHRNTSTFLQRPVTPGHSLSTTALIKWVLSSPSSIDQAGFSCHSQLSFLHHF